MQVLRALFLAGLLAACGPLFAEPATPRAAAPWNLDDALDAPGLTWDYQGAATLAVSTASPISQSSCVRFSGSGTGEVGALTTFVKGPSLLRFWLRSGSSSNASTRPNTQLLLLDQVPVIDFESGTNHNIWHRYEVAIPSGSHPLTWNFETVNGDSRGTWLVELDALAVLPEAPVDATIASALETTFTLHHLSPTTICYATSDSLVTTATVVTSPPMGDRGLAGLRLSIDDAALLRFRSRVSSQLFADVLSVQVDGIEAVRRSGEAPWRNESVLLPRGSHDVTWRYRKDPSGSDGEDRALLDSLEVFGSTSLTEALDLPNAQWTVTETSGWAGIADPDAVGGYSARWQSTPFGTSNLVTIVRGPGIVRFRYWNELAGTARLTLSTENLEVSGSQQTTTNYDAFTGWRTVELPIPDGRVQISFTLNGLNSFPYQTGSVRIDDFSVEQVERDGRPVTMAEALDCTSLAPMVDGYARGWVPAEVGDADGGIALGVPYRSRSAESTLLSLRLPWPGLFSWRWRVADPAAPGTFRAILDRLPDQSSTLSSSVWSRKTLRVVAGDKLTWRWDVSSTPAGASAPPPFLLDSVTYRRLPEPVREARLGGTVGNARWKHAMAIAPDGSLMMAGGAGFVEDPPAGTPPPAYTFTATNGWTTWPTTSAYGTYAPSGDSLIASYYPAVNATYYFEAQPTGGTFGRCRWWDGARWRFVQFPNIVSMSLAYDSWRDVLVLFGGAVSGADTNELFEFKAINSTNDPSLVNISVWPRPGARRNAAMAFDSRRGECLMYGGVLGGHTYSDLWSWDGDQWREYSSTNPAFSVPGPRVRSQMVYDPVRDRMVLFGGDYNGLIFSDTWQLDANGWTRIAGDSLGKRTLCSAVYSPQLGGIVVHGGTADGIRPLYTTMILRGDQWEPLVDFAPPQVEDCEAVWDAGRKELVLVGGRTPNGPLDGTWVWKENAWSRRSTQAPPTTEGCRLAYDSNRGVVVLHGGSLDGASSTETSEWDGQTWRRVAIAGPSRRDFAFGFDRALGKCLLWGGDVVPADESVDRSIVWGWDGATWQVQTADASPIPPGPARFAEDPVTGQLALRSGHSVAYWNAGSWTSGPDTSDEQLEMDYHATGVLSRSMEAPAWIGSILSDEWFNLSFSLLPRAAPSCLVRVPPLGGVALFGSRGTSGYFPPAGYVIRDYGTANNLPAGLLLY